MEPDEVTMAEMTISEIVDADISTLGLVSHGANREEILLLKSSETEGEVMPNELDNELDSRLDVVKASDELETKVADNIWNRFIHLFKAVAKPVAEEPEKSGEPEEPGEVESPEETPEEEVSEEDAENALPSGMEDDSAMKLKKENAPEVSNQAASTIEKGESTMPDNVEFEKATATIAELQKSQSELIARLEKAEQEAAEARESREKMVYLAKAQAYTSIPVPTSELADHLQWLAKTDAKRAEWFEDFVKSVDNMVADSEIFVEKGTRTPAPDAIEKAMQSKGEDIKKALLAVSKSDADAYLKSVRVKE